MMFEQIINESKTKLCWMIEWTNWCAKWEGHGESRVGEVGKGAWPPVDSIGVGVDFISWMRIVESQKIIFVYSQVFPLHEHKTCGCVWMNVCVCVG